MCADEERCDVMLLRDQRHKTDHKTGEKIPQMHIKEGTWATSTDQVKASLHLLKIQCKSQGRIKARLTVPALSNLWGQSVQFRVIAV